MHFSLTFGQFCVVSKHFFIISLLQRVLKHAIKNQFESQSLRGMQYVKFAIKRMNGMLPSKVLASLISSYDEKEIAFINGTTVSWDNLEALEEEEQEGVESFTVNPI
jgi:hypothetical protein